MTREDIIRMAREASIYTDNMLGSAIVGDSQLARFADLVAAAEREACAQVCEDQDTGDYEGHIYFYDGTERCSAAIRARGEKGGA